MNPRLRKLWWVAIALVVTALITVALWPEPAAVEAAAVARGPLVVTLDEQGETRSHDRYVVAAPVAGRLLRSELHEGDGIATGQVVARLAPLPLSPQDLEEQRARVAAAAAALRNREAEARHTGHDLDQAQREAARLDELFARGLVPRQQVEQARNAATTLAMDMEAAAFRVRSAAAEHRAAETGLLAVRSLAGGVARTLLDVRAPATGRVLRIPEPSERVVAAGAPLVVIGDLAHLEVVVEMLSSEAVKIAPGMAALLEGWGGEAPLRARVRLVEPYAFTKVSALGVEEQRSNVILDFVDPPERIGDGYRVTVRVITSSRQDVLQVPVSALFRCGEDWCVFVVDGNRARRRVVRIGERNALAARVLGGLGEGEAVVRHPPGELADGERVRTRS